MLISAALTIYMTVRLKTYLIWDTQGDSSMVGYDPQAAEKGQSVKRGVGIANIVISCLVVVLSVFGALTAKTSTKCRVGFFAVLSLIFSVLTLGLGVGIILGTAGTKEYID